ncbi:3-hydroxyacyl-CoA dehydrogenase [Ornithinibacillus halophilus]|uniref:NAD(P)-dependent dehydrogenase, short-chain alcohol dehydrogenase family n=1 Tax=Ornithinibacillus halophilus TaxID=930117 RepID=A0A1M5GX41_9BACI|nr:3-hydroxyacyl-CoA dehydrogenase [Ornithinibacillus halophilus]SHG08293.1 NAD(P)-dependent dehydrogenase, short-chain alcohol dehydrogenase family [Ornithinibacillus halophilus]
MDSRDVVAIVTGGASGLGEATVKNIINTGGKVAIFDLNKDRANRLIDEIDQPDKLIFFTTDVTIPSQVEENIKKVREYFGTINVLVNCAGIATPGKVLSRKGPMSLEAFQQVVQINLIGTFNVLRIASSYMVENMPNQEGERGIIINTASVAAFEGQIGQAAYSASKGAVASMTLPIAREFANQGIRVMAIAPGLFETPMFDTLPEPAKEQLGRSVPFPNRLGYPREYARLVESIITNPMLNGEVIRLDGAIRMQPK